MYRFNFVRQAGGGPTHGILLSSDPDFFPLHKPANITATQSNRDSPTCLMNTLHLILRKKCDTPPVKLYQSLPAEVPVSSNSISYIFPPSKTFSYPPLALPPGQIPLSTLSQIAQPQFSTFEPQILLKRTQIKPSYIVHNPPPTIFNILPRLSVPTSLSTPIGQPMPIFKIKTC